MFVSAPETSDETELVPTSDLDERGTRGVIGSGWRWTRSVSLRAPGAAGLGKRRSLGRRCGDGSEEEDARPPCDVPLQKDEVGKSSVSSEMSWAEAVRSWDCLVVKGEGDLQCPRPRSSWFGTRRSGALPQFSWEDFTPWITIPRAVEKMVDESEGDVVLAYGALKRHGPWPL